VSCSGEEEDTSFSIVPGTSRVGRLRSYEIHKEGLGIITTLYGTRQDAEGEVRRLEEAELKAYEAYRDTDPTALCRLGCGIGAFIASLGSLTSSGSVRGGEAAPWRTWLAGSSVEYAGTPIGSFGADAKPWRCAACGDEIGARLSKGQTAGATRAEGPEGEVVDWQL
jgi:hypothetical protein